MEKTAPPQGLEQAESSAAYGPGAGGAEGQDGAADGGRVPRFWSVRRVPAALVALLLLAGTAVLLYDVASVRADRPGMAWRRTLADELATTRLDDAAVLAGAAVAALLGLWLIVLALTPGLRGVLPMRRDVPQVRAGLERSAAALVLRDRAMEVSGVRSVRVAVTRRKVRARALAHFRELDEVRADLDSVLEEGIRQLGLARQLGLSVQVRRPAKR
nr:DUF6286 domain-containing protein [Streptomyces boncukensis]